MNKIINEILNTLNTELLNIIEKKIFYNFSLFDILIDELYNEFRIDLFRALNIKFLLEI